MLSCPEGSFPVNLGPNLPDILQEASYCCSYVTIISQPRILCTHALDTRAEAGASWGERGGRSKVAFAALLEVVLCTCNVPLLEFLLGYSRFTMLY